MINDDAKRLGIVYGDYKKANPGHAMRDFAKAIDSDQSSISRMITGKRDINLAVIRGVCFKLGYSVAWFINNTGKPRDKGDDVKLVTEIQLLRQDYMIVYQTLQRLEARMKSYEQKH